MSDSSPEGRRTDASSRAEMEASLAADTGGRFVSGAGQEARGVARQSRECGEMAAGRKPEQANARGIGSKFCGLAAHEAHGCADVMHRLRIGRCGRVGEPVLNGKQ